MRKLGKPNLKTLDVKTVRLGLAGLLAVTAVVIGAIVLLGGDSGGSSSESPETEPEAVGLSESELLARASELEGPIFWVGPRAETSSYELLSTADGRSYIRYLTGDAEVGDSRAAFVTVGTYPVTGAREALEQAAKEGEGSQALSQHDGYLALGSRDTTNVYVVFDDQPDLQIEVFSPNAGEALELATSGSLQPVG